LVVSLSTLGPAKVPEICTSYEFRNCKPTNEATQLCRKHNVTSSQYRTVLLAVRKGHDRYV